MHVCTVVPRHRLAHARVLAESVGRLHPSSRFSVLVTDAEPGEELDGDAPFDVLTPTGCGLPTGELHRLALVHDDDELCTALTPVLLGHLLDGAAADEVVVHLDAESLLVGDLGPVEELARQHGIVVLPPVLRPRRAPQRGTAPVPLPAHDAVMAQLSRLDDVGFVALTRAARPFVAWWRARMAAEVDLEAGAPIRTMDRWFALVPGPFPHTVWTDQGMGVAYWNLHERPLSRDRDGTILAGDAPLRWMRFSAYDIRRPYLLSPLQGAVPESRLSLQPVLADLVADYHRRLADAGVERWSAVPYRFGTVNGGPLPPSVRRLAATALSHLSLFEPPPLPFGPGGDAAFVRWLNQPWSSRGDRVVTLLVFHVWHQRPDVQAAYRDPIYDDAEGLARWAEVAPDFHEAWGHLHDPPPSLSGSPAGTAGPSPDELLPGYNIMGYLAGELGLGEAGRRMAVAADAAGVPYQTAAYGFVAARQLDPFAAHATVAESSAPYRVNLLCVNADSTVHLTANLPPALRRGRHRVGLWFWETEKPQPGTEGALAVLDEVWVTSRYLAEVLQPHTDKPVLVTPLAVPTPPPTRLTRRDMGLPEDKQIFLCCFDVYSSGARKNPIGTLQAYRDAFGPDDGAHLVVKSINGARRPELLEQMWYLTRDRPDIELRDGYVSRAEMNALVQLTDVYVSLHRSEGFGLNLAAAMASGKPVIATGYSGNLAFQSEENSMLVPYTKAIVGPGNEPYPPDDEWAEPDLGVATAHLRAMADPEAARALGARARADIARTNGPAVAGAWIAERLHQILDGSPAT